MALTDFQTRLLAAVSADHSQEDAKAIRSYTPGSYEAAYARVEYLSRNFDGNWSSPASQELSDLSWRTNGLAAAKSQYDSAMAHLSETPDDARRRILANEITREVVGRIGTTSEYVIGMDMSARDNAISDVTRQAFSALNIPFTEDQISAIQKASTAKVDGAYNTFTGVDRNPHTGGELFRSIDINAGLDPVMPRSNLQTVKEASELMGGLYREGLGYGYMSGGGTGWVSLPESVAVQIARTGDMSLASEYDKQAYNATHNTNQTLLQQASDIASSKEFQIFLTAATLGGSAAAEGAGGGLTAIEGAGAAESAAAGDSFLGGVDAFAPDAIGSAATDTLATELPSAVTMDTLEANTANSLASAGATTDASGLSSSLVAGETSGPTSVNLATYLGQAVGLDGTAAKIAGQAMINAAMNGGDVTKAITSSLASAGMGALSSGAAAQVNSVLSDSGLPASAQSAISNAVGGAAAGAVSAAVTGGNALKGATSGIVGSIGTTVGQAVSGDTGSSFAGAVAGALTNSSITGKAVNSSGIINAGFQSLTTPDGQDTSLTPIDGNTPSEEPASGPGSAGYIGQVDPADAFLDTQTFYENNGSSSTTAGDVVDNSPEVASPVTTEPSPATETPPIAQSEPGIIAAQAEVPATPEAPPIAQPVEAPPLAVADPPPADAFLDATYFENNGSSSDISGNVVDASDPIQAVNPNTDESAAADNPPSAATPPASTDTGIVAGVTQAGGELGNQLGAQPVTSTDPADSVVGGANMPPADAPATQDSNPNTDVSANADNPATTADQFLNTGVFAPTTIGDTTMADEYDGSDTLNTSSDDDAASQADNPAVQATNPNTDESSNADNPAGTNGSTALGGATPGIAALTAQIKALTGVDLTGVGGALSGLVSGNQALAAAMLTGFGVAQAASTNRASALEVQNLKNQNSLDLVNLAQTNKLADNVRTSDSVKGLRVPTRSGGIIGSQAQPLKRLGGGSVFSGNGIINRATA